MMMGKIVLVIMLFFSIQLNGQQRFFSSLLAGTSASQISGDDTNGFAQFGFYLGGQIRYQSNSTWSYSMGLLLNQKGARRFQSLGPKSTYRLRVNYIDVPILAHYTWENLEFTLGPALNVKINQKERTEFGEVDDQRIFKPVEFAIQGGIEYTFKEQWGIRLMYQNSFIPVRKHSPEYLVNSIPNTLIEEWFDEILRKGQYFSLFSLSISYSF